jgi:hypothetical protein
MMPEELEAAVAELHAIRKQLLPLSNREIELRGRINRFLAAKTPAETHKTLRGNQTDTHIVGPYVYSITTSTLETPDRDRLRALLGDKYAAYCKYTPKKQVRLLHASEIAMKKDDAEKKGDKREEGGEDAAEEGAEGGEADGGDGVE